MSKGRLEASYRSGKARIVVIVDILKWVENNVHFVFSPALDLTGYGESEDVAMLSFDVTLQEFLGYTQNKGTLFEELERLGWLVNKRKKRVHAPDSLHLLEDNEAYKELVAKADVKEDKKEVALSF